ncbi:hypothetical protein JCM10213v2_003353 [Rhodosporidiobolus nylandii]
MPLPSLPLELVSLILAELRLSCRNDNERRTIGRNVALVCKAWESLGLGIAWHTLELDSPAKVKSATAHFATHPRLLRFVREHRVAGRGGVPADRTPSSESGQTAADEVIALWARSPSVLSLAIITPSWLHCDRLVFALSSLSSLRHVRNLDIQPVPDPSDNTFQTSLILAFISTLHHLQELDLVFPLNHVRWIGLPPLPPDPSLLPLRKITVSPTRILIGETHPLQPATLTSLALLLESSDLRTVDLIPRFVNLTHLDVALHTPELCGVLVRALCRALGGLKGGPLTFSVREAVFTTRTLELQPLPAYPTLDALLGALPTNVRLGLVTKLYVRADALPPLHPGVQPNGELFTSADAATMLQLPVDTGEGPVARQLFRTRDGAWYSMGAADEEDPDDDY